MCGIGGLWAGKKTQDERNAIAHALADAMEHRGPDAKGIWHSSHTPLSLVHRRLSIIDTSAVANQPMHHTDAKLSIVFNGEIYNFQELKQDLEKQGASFRTTSDTEVLLAGCAIWGFEETIKRCSGMFAIALWNEKEQALYLARDRAGEKPFFYFLRDGQFVFASELVALLEAPGFDWKIDHSGLQAYTSFGYVPAPKSIVAGIEKLPPAHILKISKDLSKKVWRYWHPPISEVSSSDMISDSKEALDLVDAHLRKVVRRQMISDVPLGAFLSGGIDSSLVVSLMQSQSNSPVRTFTIGFDEKAYNEAEFAKQVAKHLGTNHEELYVKTQDSLDLVSDLGGLFDEPHADSSQLPTMLVAKMARTRVTVALSGDGGDESFAGYSRYRIARGLWAKLSKLPHAARLTLIASSKLVPPALIALVQPRREKALLGRLQRMQDLARAKDFAEFYARLLSSWPPEENPVLNTTGGNPIFALADMIRPYQADPLRMMMYTDFMHYLPNDVLSKVDTSAMRVSLESRAPLLDHQLVELSYRIPTKMHELDGKGKWILRSLLQRYLPKEIFERPKKGFSVPVATWLRGPLREWSHSLLDEKRLREQGFFDAGLVQKKLREHVRGDCDWHYLLWNILVFQAWHKKHFRA